MKRFETSEFRADVAGISLLRSKYVYKRFTFQEIDEIQIRKGNVVRNPVVIFLLGLLLISAGIYVGNMYGPINITDNHLGLKGGKALSYFIILVGGLLCFGGILIYQSLKKDFVLQITGNSFNESFPLTELREKNELDNLIFYLKNETGKKLKVVTYELGKIAHN